MRMMIAIINVVNKATLRKMMQWLWCQEMQCNALQNNNAMKLDASHSMARIGNAPQTMMIFHPAVLVQLWQAGCQEGKEKKKRRPTHSLNTFWKRYQKSLTVTQNFCQKRCEIDYGKTCFSLVNYPPVSKYGKIEYIYHCKKNVGALYLSPLCRTWLPRGWFCITGACSNCVHRSLFLECTLGTQVSVSKMKWQVFRNPPKHLTQIESLNATVGTTMTQRNVLFPIYGTNGEICQNWSIAGQKKGSYPKSVHQQPITISLSAADTTCKLFGIISMGYWWCPLLRSPILQPTAILPSMADSM